MSDFLHALAREASLYTRQFRTFDTLYVGGGTPSVLTTGQLDRLLSSLQACFDFGPSCEVTVEVNPDDVTAHTLRALRDLGVNRLSVGVQSFHDRDLAFLKRRHDGKAGKEAIESAIDAGFENLSIDLIYALPGQAKGSWMDCLEQAVAYPISHLSCYQLTVEEGTPFGRMRQEGRLRPVGERKERDLFLLTSQFLEDHGFVHYEVSNYARSPAVTSRHNAKYWSHVPYLGLGPSAHSFDGTTRWWNCKSVEGYCESLREDRHPTAGREELSGDQLRMERLYLGFRTRDGVSRIDIEDSDNSGQTLLDLVDSGVLEMTKERIVPTRKGYLIADHLPLIFM